jgi:hypothetical protein
LLGLAFLLLPLGAVATAETLSVADVLRLHQAGVSEEVILSEIMVTESVFDLSVEEILRLNDAGLSDRLIKFMIDTRVGTTDDLDSYGGTIQYEEYGEDDPYDEISAETWVNVIEEEPAVTYVSLNYSYPNWWYDNYWYDYWYWDFTYHPYQTSWCWTVNTWYPAWYSWGSCYPYYPYRHTWWNAGYYGGCGYSPFVDYAYYRDWSHSAGYASGYGRRHDLSDVKYKGGNSFSQPLYPDRGLKLPVPSVTSKTQGVVVADGRGGKVRDRTKGVGSPVGHDGGGRPVKGIAVDPVRPTKPSVGLAEGHTPPTKKNIVRAPARGDRPVKIVRPPTKDVRTKQHATQPAQPPKVDVKPKVRPAPVRQVDTPPPPRTRPTPTPQKPTEQVRPPTPQKPTEQVRPPAPTKPKSAERAPTVQPKQQRSGDSRVRATPPRTSAPKSRASAPRSGGGQPPAGKPRGR